MTTKTYVPLAVRAKQVLAALGGREQRDVFARCPILAWTGKKTHRDPHLLGTASLLFLAAVLLINPDGMSPYLANTLCLLPAGSSLKHLGRLADATADDATLVMRKETSARLLDFWIVSGFMTMLERILGVEAVARVVPLWYVGKGMGAVWCLLATPSLPGQPQPRSKQVGTGVAPKATPMATSTARSTSRIAKPSPLDLHRSARGVKHPFREPSPSPAPETDSTQVGLLSAAARSAILSSVAPSSPAFLTSPGTPRSAVLSPNAPPSPPESLARIEKEDERDESSSEDGDEDEDESDEKASEAEDEGEEKEIEYDEDPFEDDLLDEGVSEGIASPAQITVPLVVNRAHPVLTAADAYKTRRSAVDVGAEDDEPLSSASPAFILHPSVRAPPKSEVEAEPRPAFISPADTPGLPLVPDGGVHRLSLDELLMLEEDASGVAK